MTGTRSAARAVALAVVMLVAGCAGTGPRPVETDARPVVPMPPGVQDPAPATAGPTVTPSSSPPPACDPRASFRPAALPAADQAPDSSTIARIKKNGRVVIGVDQNAYLFSYRDSAGQLVGFDIDIATAIGTAVAAAVFGEPTSTAGNRISFKAINAADRIPMIKDHSVDLVVRSMTITCERWQQVAFSTEYLTARQAVLVRRDSGLEKVGSLQDLQGRKVCAAKSTTSLRTIQQAEKPVPVAVDSTIDCMVMLQQGQVDAISTDDLVLAGLAAQDPSTMILNLRLSDEPWGVAMSGAPVDRDLVRFVNGVLDRLRITGWKQMYSTWLSGLGQPPDPPQPRYRD